MINKLRLTALLMGLIGGESAFANYSYEDMLNLRNDKEAVVTTISRRERTKILSMYETPESVSSFSHVFYKSVQDTLNEDPGVCDLGFVKRYTNNLEAAGFDSSEDDVEETLKALRVHHYIDDVLYKMTSEALKDYHNLEKLNVTRNARKSRANEKLLEFNNVEELFGGFSNWPNDKNYCTYQSFYYIKNNIFISRTLRTDKSRDVRALISEAYKRDIISLESFHKLNYLNSKAKLDKRDTWLRSYLQVILRAKNKMVPIESTYVVQNIEDENRFSTEKVKRFSRLTRRRLLYRKYNETQIILLAQILQKASRRMGVDPDTETSIPFITQEFTIMGPAGEPETYVETLTLDPQSQYNLARRRLRKDMVELQMMDIFHKSKITHEDIVVAALETGYISLDDLEHVVKYDDLWNPNITRFQKISGFIFNVAGYSTFFIPPPWNITAAIALGVIEGIVDNRNSTGEDNDNPATFF